MPEQDPITRVEYRPIPGFPGYWAGDDGTIWCAHNTRRRPNKTGEWIEAIGSFCRRIDGTITKRGYVRVMIQRAAGDYATRFVHDLILEAFVGPCPPGMECRHWDGRRTNNRLTNLLWGTPLENAEDRKRHGTQWTNIGSLNGRAAVDETVVAEIKRAFASGAGTEEVASRFGIKPVAANKIYCGITWKHVPWPAGFVPARRKSGRRPGASPRS